MVFREFSEYDNYNNLFSVIRDNEIESVGKLKYLSRFISSLES